MKVLVTGGNGFVGSRLVKSLADAGHEVVATVRHPFEGMDADRFVVLAEEASFSPILDGVGVVVHTAGVAHRPAATVEDYRRGNRDLTFRLAADVADSGARAMVHLSSIAAREAAATEGGRPAAYGLSKLAAEPAVTALSGTGKLGVNLRPPLVYGPGAPGNWAKLVRLARLPLPLPFASVNNRRSYLALDHLVDAILALIAKSDQPALSGTYELADRESPSLAEVVTAVRRGLSRRPGLIPFPPSLLGKGLRIAGREAMAEGLFGDLLLDAAPFEAAFAWRPARPTLEAMEASLA